MNKITVFEKLSISARYFLVGLAATDKKFNKAIDAMEHMLDITKDAKRNDGEPEAIHPIRIFQHTRTYHQILRQPASSYVLAFLHDLGEDFALSVETVEHNYGSEIAEAFDIISKNIGAKKKNSDTYIANCFQNELVSLIKPIDRNDNISTMIKVFKPERRDRYFSETTEKYLPQFKIARRKFPHHEAIYENLKIQLRNQLNLIDHIIAVSQTNT